MAPTSPNLYITRKLNNMDQAQVMKKKRKDWTRLLLWNALDTNIFLFILSIFLDFIFLFF